MGGIGFDFEYYVTEATKALQHNVEIGLGQMGVGRGVVLTQNSKACPCGVRRPAIFTAMTLSKKKKILLKERDI